MIIVGQTPTLDTSAYSAGDAVGGLLTFDVGSVGARTVVLKRAEILDDLSSPDSASLELHLFTDATMVVADQAAFSVSTANWLAGKHLGFVAFTSYAATYIGTNAAAVLSTVDDINRLIPLQKGKVYGQLVATGTPTFAATQLYVRLWLAEYA